MNATTQTPTAEQTAIMKGILSEYDIHFLTDDSGSMNEPQFADQPNGPTRFQYAREVLSSILPVALEIDNDGINIATLNGSNGRQRLYRNATMATISEIFAQPAGGGTPLAEGLETIFSVAGESPKKDLVVVLLDGEPTPGTESKVEAVIANQANKQENDDDLTILMVQLGNVPSCSKFLQKLDDKIPNAKFDIVDTIKADALLAAPSFAHALKAAITG